MAEPKTTKTEASVDAFLQQVADPTRREDAYCVLELMSEITGEPPAMWGGSIVGFGSRHYQYASGREGDWPLVGFSPRKGDLTLYIIPGLDRYSALLAKLGKHKTGKSCLYIKRLADVDPETLRELIRDSVAQQRAGDEGPPDA